MLAVFFRSLSALFFILETFAIPFFIRSTSNKHPSVARITKGGLVEGVFLLEVGAKQTDVDSRVVFRFPVELLFDTAVCVVLVLLRESVEVLVTMLVLLLAL